MQVAEGLMVVKPYLKLYLKEHIIMKEGETFLHMCV